MPVFRCENGCMIFRQVETEVVWHVVEGWAELVGAATIR